MKGTIHIHCPEMPVLNTGWGIWSDREAQELPCTGHLVVDGRWIDLVDFKFPKCKVTNIAWGEWLVDEVTASGRLSDGGTISIEYPPEPVVRKGRNMVALAIPNIGSKVVLGNGLEGRVKAPLPEAIGRPEGWFGLKKFIVDAVDIKGTVSF